MCVLLSPAPPGLVAVWFILFVVLGVQGREWWKKEKGGMKGQIFFLLFLFSSFLLKKNCNGLLLGPLLFTDLILCPLPLVSPSCDCPGQMPVACRMPPTSRACRRSLSVHWRSMWGASTLTSPAASANCYCDCPLCAPCPLQSSSSCSSSVW